MSTTPKNVVESNSQAQSASSSQKPAPSEQYTKFQSTIQQGKPPAQPVSDGSTQFFIQRTASTGYSGLDSSGQGTYFAGTPSMSPAERFTQQIGTKGIEQMGYTPVSTMQGERYVRLEKSPQQEYEMSGNVVGPYKPVKFARLRTYAGDFATGFRFGSRPDLYAYTENDMRLDPQKSDRILAYGFGSALSVASVTGTGRGVLATVGTKVGSTSTVSSLLKTPVGKFSFGFFGGTALLGYGAQQAESFGSALKNKDYLEAGRVVVNIGFDIGRMRAFGKGLKQGIAKSEFRSGSSQTQTPSNYKYGMTTTETNIGGTSKSMTSGYIAEYAKPSASKPNRVISFTDYGNVREIIGQDLKTGQISVTYQNLYSGKTVSTSYFAPKSKFYTPSQLEQGFIGQKLFVDKTQSRMLVPTSMSWSQPSYAEITAYQNQPKPEFLTLFGSSSLTLKSAKTSNKFESLIPKTQNLAVAERTSFTQNVYESDLPQPSKSLLVKSYDRIQNEQVTQLGISKTATFKQTDLFKQIGTGEIYNLDTGRKVSTETSMIKTKVYPQFELGEEVSNKKMFDFKPRKVTTEKYKKEMRYLEDITPPSAVKLSQTTTTSIGEKRELSWTTAYLGIKGQSIMVPKYRTPLIHGKKAQAGFSFEPISITKPKTQVYKVSTVKVESPNYSYDLGKVWSQSNLVKTKSNLGVSSLALLGSATKLDSKLKLDTKTNLSSRSSSKRLPDKIQTLKVNTRIDTSRAISPKTTSSTFTIQLTQTKSVLQTKSVSTAIPSYLRNVSIRPPKTPTQPSLKTPTQPSLPTWGLGGRSLKGRSVKGSGFGFGNVAKYTPSLVAYEFNIRGKRKRKDDKELFTGFEIRPL